MSNKQKGFIFGGIAIIVTAFILFLVITQNQPALPAEAKQKEIKSEKASPVAEPTEQEKPNMEIAEKETDSKEEKAKEESKKKETKKDDTEQKNNEEESISFEKKYITVSSLNLRSDPNTQSDVLGVLMLNEEIQAADTNLDNGWIKVKTKSGNGYVNSKYLSSEKKVITATAQKVKKKTTEKSANNKNTQTQKQANKPKEQASSDKKQEKPVKATPKNDAEKLSSVGNNNQLILVTTNGYGTSSAKVQTFERGSSGEWQRVMHTNGFIGKNGFAGSKVEGDGKSPTGKYSIGTAFGRAGNPGTKLPFRSISSDDVWVDDPKSSLYNSWQSRKKTEGQWNSAENMDIALYTYGFVINYNTARTPGKGSAIFFHVANGHTLGCTGVSQSHMVSILKWINPAKNPVIIQTPESKLSNY
ncbi:SH3 domain-containing protein [Virgibacillus halodenitrificans]|uniref:SH3 domain-containing protein n=1 Tax=Virgibacillus halodenitrificans TaxID=1482 RepID=UPI000760BE4B